ncbi:class I SAM-dependent methyltransferase [Stenotrophomonas sp. NPDC077421]|uniref:class I SAM-dependent methyltransferase n=1 Tax=Stenotrophomonas sp. NPDC077421 TaxID=3414699 RepID=UPI003C307279
MINITQTKSLLNVTQEWDAIARIREEQISSGKDHSANFVLGPAILSELPKIHNLVDIGCGTGWLTSQAAGRATATVGVDPSGESIAIARERHSKSSVSYFAESVEQMAKRRKRPSFDAAISNMAASSSPDLEGFFRASRKLLREDGLFIATIPHPCFWPLYWGYASHPSFHYERTFAVEADFKIRDHFTDMRTTHFHHPLQKYLSSLSIAGFAVKRTLELSGRGFDFPRFMLLVSRAI